MNHQPQKQPREGEQPLELWVIYERPTDHPQGYVVRCWLVGPGDRNGVEQEARTAATLDEARKLVPPDLFNLGRNQCDDPVIVEVWV